MISSYRNQIFENFKNLKIFQLFQKYVIWCDVEIFAPIVLKEILKYDKIRLHILKVQTLKYKSTVEKFLKSILCLRNKQSKTPEVTYLSHTPQILFQAPKYYAARPRWR